MVPMTPSTHDLRPIRAALDSAEGLDADAALPHLREAAERLTDLLDEARALQAATEVVHGRYTARIIMDIRGGALQAVYGDRLPEGVQVEFILRDYDNIAAGDADPMNEDYAPDVYYW